jgi:two-component system cell cycle sensor histidine kinase/response regulator CckA
MSLETCDLDQLLRDTHSLLRHLLGPRVNLSVGFGSGEWHVNLDPTQMQQVLVNLSVNARDAMPDGGKLNIAVRRVLRNSSELAVDEVNRDWLCLQVTDTGTGMPPEVVKHVFEPFFSTKDTGTGLGLATSYGIVQQCGGRIECRTEVDKGTSFLIYLPRADEVHQDDYESSPRASDAPAGTVLVVEDQEPVLRVVKKALVRAGFEVLATESPVQAIEIMKSGAGIDLLLSDVVMPEIGGVELARRARELKPGIHLILMSGYSAEPLAEQLQELGDAELLEKPFRTTTLVERVRRALRA